MKSKSEHFSVQKYVLSSNILLCLTSINQVLYSKVAYTSRFTSYKFNRARITINRLSSWVPGYTLKKLDIFWDADVELTFSLILFIYGPLQRFSNAAIFISSYWPRANVLTKLAVRLSDHKAFLKKMLFNILFQQSRCVFFFWLSI